MWLLVCWYDTSQTPRRVYMLPSIHLNISIYVPSLYLHSYFMIVNMLACSAHISFVPLWFPWTEGTSCLATPGSSTIYCFLLEINFNMLCLCFHWNSPSYDIFPITHLSRVKQFSVGLYFPCNFTPSSLNTNTIMYQEIRLGLFSQNSLLCGVNWCALVDGRSLNSYGWYILLIFTEIVLSPYFCEYDYLEITQLICLNLQFTKVDRHSHIDWVLS